MSLLNTSVSCFESYREAEHPRTVNLLTWLRSTRYRREVERIRRTAVKKRRDRLKAALPAITPSGIFHRRAADQLILHSGLLQFDIDAADNRHLPDFHRLIDRLRDYPFIAYAGRSVSGRGWWGLVPISRPERHREHFRALVADFQQQGILLDNKPANVASLRGYSFDADAYYNHQAELYTGLLEMPKPDFSTPHTLDLDEEARRVEHYLQQIEARELDLTADYGDWFSLACALANAFGENGRAYFHRLSQFYPDYDPADTDYKFNSALRGRYNYTLGTFYHFCHLAELDRPRRKTSWWRRIRKNRPGRRRSPITRATVGLQLELPFQPVLHT